MFGTDAHPYDPTQTQKAHGERVEARQRERAEGLKREAEVAEARKRETKSKDEDVDALIGLFMDIVLHDALHSLFTPGKLAARQAEAPLPKEVVEFTDFWEGLNAHCRAAGRPEPLYGEARELYLGSKTPQGALTFVGKPGDGIRAVPAGKGYYAEYHVSTPNGSIWRKVRQDITPHSPTRVFDLAEHALASAAINKLGVNKSA